VRIPGDIRTVVVLWTGHRAGPWVCRSLRAAGWDVVPAHPVDEGRGRSTAAWSPRRVPSSRAPEALLASLRALCREMGAGAVLPVDEDCVRLLAGWRDALGGARAVAPTPAQWDALCDKAGLRATAGRAGVGHPATAVVSAAGVDGALPEPPAVVKVRGDLGPGRGAVAVVPVRTRAERDAAVALLVAEGLDAVVQERLEGVHRTVHCVRAADAFRAVTGRILRTRPRGAGMPSVIAVDGCDERVADAARRVLDAAGYVGPANVQFFERDGELLVHDVNLRPPAPVAMSMRAGLDLPALGLAAALGLPLGPARRARGGFRYVSLVDELRAAREEGRTPPGRRRVLGELAEAAVSPRALLDPPLRDPLWVVPLARSVVPDPARRAVRAARRILGASSPASP
jgi:carbamoyl-phosphate synthase large subunit